MNEYKVGWRLFRMHDHKRANNRYDIDRDEYAELLALGITVIPARDLDGAKRLALTVIPRRNPQPVPAGVRVYTGIRYIYERKFSGVTI